MKQSDKVIQFTRAKCQHNKFIVDESLESVQCGVCGKNLNPMWVIQQFSRYDSRLQMHLSDLKELAKKAEKKNRCKCENCGKMTRIQK